jgi:hypothetical protein
MVNLKDINIIRLAELKESLNSFVKPEILKALVELSEALGTDKNSFVQQFKFWLQKNGEDCRYAAMCKQFFLKDQAAKTAEKINFLYHNWSKFYE